jgi:hypothetical protein
VPHSSQSFRFDHPNNMWREAHFIKLTTDVCLRTKSDFYSVWSKQIATVGHTALPKSNMITSQYGKCYIVSEPGHIGYVQQERH